MGEFIVYQPLKRAKCRPVSGFGQETVPKRFPQTIARLSKANVGRSEVYVNVDWKFSIILLFNREESAENVGQAAE
jgi:hypothetical protein